MRAIVQPLSEADMQQRWTLANRPIFPAYNGWGIPQLLSQAVTLPDRLALKRSWSGAGSLVNDRTLQPLPGSTICFYVDDYRIEPLWNRPLASLRRLEDLLPAAVIEPDFSQYSDHPAAVAIWNLYRSRWVARYWQEHGLTVIPSLNWNAQMLDMIGLGIPRGAVVACEARPRFKDSRLLLAGLRAAVKQIAPAAVLLYGAADGLREQVPSGPEYRWLPAWSPRKRIEAQSKRHE